MPFDFGNNLNRYLRMAQLFGEPEADDSSDMGGSGIDFSSIDTGEDDFNPISRMRQLYQPDTRMSDRFNTLMDQFPHRENFQPGKLRKIAALAASFGKPEGVEQALYSPFHRALGDWKEEIGPVSRAAEIERNANVNQRMVANNILSQEMSGRRLERQYGRDRVLEEQGNRRLQDQEKNARTREDQAAQRIKQADERLKIANKLAKGGVLNVDDDGNARIVYKDGTTEDVDGSYLSFEEKEQAKAKNRTTGSRTIKTDTIEDPDDPSKKVLVQIHEDGTFDIIRKRTPKGEAPGPEARPTPRTTESTASRELGTSRERLNRAQKLKLSRPDLSPYIKIDKGQIKVDQAGMFTSDAKKKKLDEINKLLGSDNEIAAPNNTAPTKSTTPVGRVKVRLPDGRTGTIDRKEVSQLPPGSQVLEQ